MVLFRDRVDAGKQLAKALQGRGIERPLVLAIPRGGVPVAAEVAEVLGGELGVVVARKLGAPGQPELAIGAITSDGVCYLNERLVDETGARGRYLAEEQGRQAAEARRREEAFDGQMRPPAKGRDVIVVDDGIATGATAIAAVRSMKGAGARRVILAVPVGPPETIEKMRSEADEVVCVAVERDFWAIGQFYADFRPVEDDQVRAALAKAAKQPAGGDRREATVERDGVRLAVRLATPAGEGPFPAVVFVHGLGSGKDSPRNVVIAHQLFEAGIATVLFDLSGHGESSHDPRGMDAYVDDLAAVEGWVRRQPDIDGRRVGVAGSSLGGVVALEAVRAGRSHPAALVLRGPPAERRDFGGLAVPTLVVVGGADPLAADILAAADGCAAVKVAVVQGAGHLFEEEGTLDLALARTIDWFATRLGAGRGAAVV